MASMQKSKFAVLLLAAAQAWATPPELTEENFRQSLGVAPTVRVDYRDLECRYVDFVKFADAMSREGAHADVERAVDGSAVTVSVKLRGMKACPSPYPPLSGMPPFELRDLDGRRVTSASLRGKPTLMSFFYSTCVPCIREVEPLNRFAAARPQMNFLAVTFDEPEEARAFVKRYGLAWRVIPDAQVFIDSMRIKQYPLLALFDAEGRLLGTRLGGAKDDLEAASIEPKVARWTEGLLKK